MFPRAGKASQQTRGRSFSPNGSATKQVKTSPKRGTERINLLGSSDALRLDIIPIIFCFAFKGLG